MITTIIAEIGNNHNGCMKRAERLIRSAKEAGADIAKFQLRDWSKLYRTAPGSIEDLGVEYTKDILKKYELSKEDHRVLREICNRNNIEYMCTPWDTHSLLFLEKLGVKRYKIASADFNNFELINRAIRTNKQLIFSTGMATTEEIKIQAKYLRDHHANYAFLHCNSTYPAPFIDIELNYLNSLQEICDVVGYSGHERGVAVSVAAVALGATIIERHITEDKDL